MNSSSGMKRGLASVAISALAVTGLPFLALSASATPIADEVDANNGDATSIEWYSVNTVGNTFSPKNDGTNTTVSLVVGGGSSVTSVIFQYQATSTGATWTNAGPAVARNADGVFAFDWTNPPTDVTALRAVPNTGVGETQTKTPAANLGAAADTVELASEGSLGVFQELYTEGPYAATTSELVGVTGTVSQGSGAPDVSDASHGTAGSDDTTLETTTDTASDTFNSVLDIDGYPYSGGTEPNQIAIDADVTDSDDAEGSTLYVQTIGSITATPATQEDVTPADAEVDLTVLDTTGEPVAGAQVFRGGDTDTDGAGPDTDTDGAEALVGYTDGRGQIKDVVVGGATTVAYYVNTTDTDAYQAGIDPTTNATVTTYVPTLATVDIVNERNRADFDLDELETDDDFTIETRDQRGNLYDETIAGNDVEYRWVVDPDAVGEATQTSNWLGDAYLTDNADGTYQVDELTDADWNDNTQFPTATTADLPIGTYTLEARRPNVAGAGLTNATPETVRAGESDIVFDDGNSANAPVNGDHMVTGALLNDDGTPLANRGVEFYWSSTGDAVIAPESEQPAGVEVFSGTYAEAVTDANGEFAIKVSDPDIPDNVEPTPEDGEMEVWALEDDQFNWYLWDDNGPDDAPPYNGSSRNAVQVQTVHFQELADVDEIILDIDTLAPTYEFGGADGGPGVPLDIDVIVEDAANNDLADYPVEVTIDEGFLSDDAETADQLNLADDHDSAGDLYGFFENLGTTQTVNTGDNGDEAGIVAAIERNEGFDDDGEVTSTITVTAGDVTVTREVTWDVGWLLNVDSVDLEPAAGEPSGQVPTDEDVELQLYVFDQFENLAGDEWTDISDDSTIADFETDEDGDETQSDFIFDGPGIRAFSDAPATQNVMARTENTDETIVTTEGTDPLWESKDYTGSEEIEWVAPDPDVINAALTLKGNDNGARNDNLFANAHRRTEGSEVHLFRRTKAGNWKMIRTGIMNAKGNFKFKNVKDRNGNKVTKYKAVVEASDDTRRGVGRKGVR